MKKVSYTSWWGFKKQGSDIKKTLAQIDLYNKTEYSKRTILDESTSIEAARYAHENQMVYYVTISENEKPFCYLEINKGFYRINYLDDYLRLFMSYDFYGNNYDEAYGNKLFLGKVAFWEFDGKTDRVLKYTEHIFKADGTFKIVERNQITNEQIDSEAKKRIDVSSNWEEYPEFGEYESVIRIERD